MRLRETAALLWIILLVPVTLVGAYFSYTQSRQRVQDLNNTLDLSETDIEKTLRLVLRVDDVSEADAESATAPNLEDGPSTPPALLLETDTAAPEAEDSAAPAATESVAEPVDSAAVEPVPPLITDPRRVTVLLMGIDQREGEDGQFRTDTMIVLSMDPVAKTGAMLSIPRDIWISIPGGFGESRINTANYIGDNPELNFPGGGPALAMLAVEKLVGVPIDHYMLINFSAFTTLIETIGPIEICVQELIDDPKYPDGSYGYLPIRIEPGCQDMDAPRLLQYARTRATAGGDFDRATRQQEVITAVREKVLSTGGIRNLLGDSLTLWDAVNENVRTDMTLDEMVELALIAQEVVDIRQGTIGTGEVFQGMAPDGSEILIPIQTDIIALVGDLFRPADAPSSLNPAGESAATTDAPFSETTPIVIDPNNLPLPVREEAAIIGLLNGTTIRGRAGNLQQVVLGYNLDVGTVSNHSSTDIGESFIMYYGDHEITANYLAQILAQLKDGQPVPVQQGEGTRPEGDVLVIIGTDLNIPEAQQ